MILLQLNGATCCVKHTLSYHRLNPRLKQLISCAAKSVRICYLRKKEIHSWYQSRNNFVSKNKLTCVWDNWVMWNLFSHKIYEYSHRNGFLIKLNCVWISTVSVWIPHPHSFSVKWGQWRSGVSYPGFVFLLGSYE